MKVLSASRTVPETALPALVGKALILGQGARGPAATIAEQRGWSAAAEVLKSVGAGNTGDPAWAAMGANGSMTRAFIELLRSGSIFFRMLSDGAFARVPLRTPAVLQTANATGWIVGQGKPVPLSTMAFARRSIQPTTAAAMIVVTDDMFKEAGNAGEAVLSRALRGAVAKAVDEEFLRIVDTTGTLTVTSGALDIEDIRNDLRRLLNEVSTTGRELLYWAASPDVGNLLTLIDDPRAELSPTGGVFLGVPFMVTDALSQGQLWLMDATGIGGDTLAVTLDASDQADVEMEEAPSNNSDSPSGANLVSMFQTNSVALMARAVFGAEKFRASAVAKLVDIPTGDSPA